MFELTTDAHFDSAHFLTDYYGKCENLHGHRWGVSVAITSSRLQAAGNELGMVMDFGQFKKIVKEVADEFDHTTLLEAGSLKDETVKALIDEGFTVKILSFRTTAENLAKYFCQKLEARGLNCSWVEVRETPNNRAKYINN